MRPSIIRNLFSNKTLLHHGLTFALTFWALALIPLCVAMNIYLTRAEEKVHTSERAAVQRLLFENFEQSSRFGDLVNARGQAIQLGASLGLKDLGICLNGKDVLPRPIESRCNKEDGVLIPIRINDINYLLEFDWQPLKVPAIEILLKSLIISAFLSLLIIAATVIFLSRRLSALLNDIGNEIIRESAFENPEKLEFRITELNPIVDSLFIARKKLTESLEANAQLQTAAALGSLAVQVAHDIRSPLTALEILAADSGELTESQLMLRASLARIRGIANDLLQRNREITFDPKEGEVTTGHDIGNACLNPLMRSLIMEKAQQYSGQAKVQLLTNVDSAPDAFAKVDTNILSRVLSNLIDNSFESLIEGGKIEVNLYSSSSAIRIVVSDTGKGIPKSRLPALMIKGATFDKVNGSGLGLYFAKRAVNAFKGSIEIESEVGVGTNVIIQLPASSPELSTALDPYVFQTVKVAFIDDEGLNRKAWMLAARAKKIDLSCFPSVEEFLGKFEAGNERILVFIDMNLANGESGLIGAKRLYDAGFEELYISTGNKFDRRLEGLPFIKGVFDKTPPWLKA